MRYIKLLAYFLILDLASIYLKFNYATAILTLIIFVILIFFYKAYKRVLRAT